MIPRHRNALPQLGDKLFLTDGGLETTLVFVDQIDLPHFAAVALMRNPEGRDRLRSYYRRYAAIAREANTGFIFESPTWRASRDWAEKLGMTPDALQSLNRKSIMLMAILREELESKHTPMVLSGCIGPRGDGYNPVALMNAAEAEDYHSEQIATFRDTEADMVTAITMNYVEEAIGIARAADAAGMPSAISFTLETDGRLPTGQTLKDAILEVDRATGAAPAYYMINCAHPTHFVGALDAEAPWVKRIRGLRANASKMSHAELDAATALDDGDPAELGHEHAEILKRLPHITVLGGCCGTDHRHVAAIAHSCVSHAHHAAYAA
jgi:S-methylmethionine-dependent homocysteine/selenocysteine methylase